LVFLAACVGPARSFGAYEGKAGATANDMLSAVQTVRLAADTAARHRAFGPYLSVVINDAERDASAIQGAFDSIQPPDGSSDRLRRELDSLLAQAVSTIADLRIAVRRGELDRLAVIAEPLRSLAGRLDAFTETHT
jgi:hypothetical protein